MNPGTANSSETVNTATGRYPLRGGLAGKNVVVTRAPHQAADMAAILSQFRAETLFYPCIDIVPPEDVAPLDAALQAAADGRFDWLVVTSANTALILARRLKALDLSLTPLRVAAVGPKTAAVVKEALHIDVDVVADKYVAEGLAVALQPAAALRFLLPQSEIARPVLANNLRAAGAEVTVVDAYRTVIGQGGDDIPHLLAKGEIDAVTFTSSSTVRYFLQRLTSEGGRRSDLAAVCLAAIGPITAETMKELDLPVAVVPDEYTLPALVAALETNFLDKKS